MTRKIYFLFFFCALAGYTAKAQNSHWQAMFPNWYTSYSVLDFYEDTTANLLYMAGGAQYSGVTVYDGNSISSYGAYGGSARKIIKYHDTLYIGGVTGNYFLQKRVGANWDTITCNGPVLSFCVYNDELYVGGDYTSIAGINARGLAKYNGSTWSTVDSLNLTWCNGISTIEVYNGELYIGGDFLSPHGNRLSRWNGTQWNSVGIGVLGPYEWPYCMEVYNNELYIGGYFWKSDGNVGDYIMKWNGSFLSEVGGGVSGTVTDLMPYNNSLYAVGGFTYAGGIHAQKIAKWDGTNWCGFGDSISSSIEAMGTYNGELFIGGYIWLCTSTDTIAGLAKWIGGNYVDTCGNITGIAESHPSEITVSIFPNPMFETGTIQVEGSNQPFTFLIFDQLGREIWRKESSGNELEFSTEGIAPGLYYFSIIQNGEIRKSGKLIVQL